MITRRTTLAALAATPLLGTQGLAQEETITVNEMVLGNEDATVTLMEYASFTCPHCASFHKDTFPQLKENYIDTGKIKFVFRDVYFDRFGLWASMIARCDDTKFFGVSDMLFKRQADWSRAGTPADVIAEIRKIGLLAGLTNEAMDACLNDQKMAEALVARFQETTGEHEVSSTPTLVINDKNEGNMSYPSLAALLDTALEG